MMTELFLKVSPLSEGICIYQTTEGLSEKHNIPVGSKLPEYISNMVRLYNKKIDKIHIYGNTAFINGSLKSQKFDFTEIPVVINQ